MTVRPVSGTCHKQVCLQTLILTSILGLSINTLLT